MDVRRTFNDYEEENSIHFVKTHIQEGHLFCGKRVRDISLPPELLIVTLSATLAGSVFGDHTSPISDTTILASTGAQCNHLKHVGTQVPYACTVAVCCLIGYIIAGFTGKLGLAACTAITLPSALVLLFIALIIMRKIAGPARYQNEAAQE